MITEELLEKFRERHPELIKYDFDLEGVNSGYELFDDFRKDTLLVTSNEFKNEITIIKTQILALNTLSAYCLQSETKTNIVLNNEFTANDFHLAAILTNISNTTQSILELCLIGFNTQAHVLYRTLIERTMQAIILLNNNKDIELWLTAQDSNSSKEIHYELFSKRDRMFKQYESIECDLLNFELNNQKLRALHKERLTDASQVVHGASSQILLGSYAFQSDNDAKPAIFGAPCLSSHKILNDTVFEIWFLLVLLTRTLKNKHKWIPDYSNELVLGFEIYRYTAHKLFESAFGELET